MPDMTGGYGAALGGLLAIAGTAIIGSEADAKKKKAMELANTPGLDFTDLTRQALTGYNANFGEASALADKLSTTDQLRLNKQLELAQPGITAARAKELASITSLFDTDPQFFQDQMRLGAGLNLEQGLFGSGAGQLATLNRTSQARDARIALGSGLINAFSQGVIKTNTPSGAIFMGTPIQDQVAQRALERTQRIGLLQQAYAMPSALGVWGNELQTAGHALAGVGTTSGSGGGGGYGGFGGSNFSTGNSGTSLYGDFGGGSGWS